MDNNDAIPTQQKKNSEIKDYLNDSLGATTTTQIPIDKILERVAVDNSFRWPESRQKTEYIIQLLKERRVLFIRAPESKWLHAAALRLATVLNSSINRLWPNCDGVYRLSGTAKFPFSCWEKQEFEKTKLIIVPRKHTAEYLDRLLNTDWDTAHHTWISSLHKANICLLIPVPETEAYTNYFKTAEDDLSNEYASWNLNVISLELTRLYYNEGLSFYEELIITPAYEDCNINSLLRHLSSIRERVEDFSDFKGTLAKAIVNYNTQRDEDENYITDLLENNKDPLKIIIIFIAAFFENITIRDFELLVGLIIGERELPPVKGDERRPASVKCYKDLWSDFLQVESYRTACRLQTFVEEHITYIRFASNGLAERIQQLFLTEYRMMFSLLFKRLSSNGIIFNNELSTEFYPSLVKVIMTNATQNITDHDEFWLIDLLREQALVIDTSKRDKGSLNDILDDLPRELVIRYFNFVQERLVLLMQHMLMRKEEKFTNIINEFFRLLLDNLDKKMLAIELAIRLYNELKDHEKFSATQIFGYFRQALNESDKEERFQIYCQMQYHFDKQDMYQKTDAWIKDLKDEKANKHARQYAWLFRLDYCIYLFDKYITDGNKVEDRYRLFTPGDEDAFTPSFIQLLEDMCKKECLNSWYEVLSFRKLYELRFDVLERVISGEENLIGRVDDDSRTVITLAADIYENWFYIISIGNKDEILRAAKQKEFGKVLRTVLSDEHLVDIKTYWVKKSDDIYDQTMHSIVNEHENTKEVQERIDKLKARKDRLIELLLHVNA